MYSQSCLYYFPVKIQPERSLPHTRLLSSYKIPNYDDDDHDTTEWKKKCKYHECVGDRKKRSNNNETK